MSKDLARRANAVAAQLLNRKPAKTYTHHIVQRNGVFLLFRTKVDAYHWPWPLIEARTVRGLSEMLQTNPSVRNSR